MVSFPFYVTWFFFFSSTLWGQSSTWQFLFTFLTHFPLSQNKLIGVSRSHKKDLAQRWLNIFLSSSFQSVEIFSATSFLLLWCDELSFFIKQVLPSRDLFSPVWNNLKWGTCEEQIYDHLWRQKVVFYASVRMALFMIALRSFAFFDVLQWACQKSDIPCFQVPVEPCQKTSVLSQKTLVGKLLLGISYDLSFNLRAIFLKHCLAWDAKMSI